jgi:hypothetical protein
LFAPLCGRRKRHIIVVQRLKTLRLRTVLV